MAVNAIIKLPQTKATGVKIKEQRKGRERERKEKRRKEKGGRKLGKAN